MSEPSRVEPWRVDADAFPAEGPASEKLAFLVRYAILAPSSHNAQPWRFELGDGEIGVVMDESRWLRVADADRRELRLSAGCALENLLLAAEHFGYGTSVAYMPDGPGAPLAARVTLAPGAATAGPENAELFAAIPHRHTNRHEYDGDPVEPHELDRLRGVADGEGIVARFTTDPAVRRRVDALVARADAIQFADPEWRAELGEWLGAGVLGTGWLMSKVARLAVTHLDLGKETARKDSQLLRSAPVLGMLTLDPVDPAGQVRAGRAFERLFLMATRLGLALQPMNQILQLPDVEREFRALLPDDWGRPQITFRLGRAEAADRTPRRAVPEVLA